MKRKLASAFIGIIFFSAVQTALSAETPTLRYVSGGNSTSLSQLPITVARTKGFFEREGLHVEFVTNDESNSAAAAQGYNPSIERGGPGDITTVSGGFFIHAVLNGSDAVAISSQTANPVYSLIVRPEVRTYSDLRGKEITLTAPWDTITVTTRKLLALHGIGPTDFQFRRIRNSDARLECLQSGECAAISAGQPHDIKAINLGLGYHRLGITNEAGPVVFNMEIVRREWAQENRDVIVRYLRAAAGAMRFINDPENRQEVMDIIREITGEPQEIVDEIMASYEDPALRILPREAELDMEGLQNLLDLIEEAGLHSEPLPPAEHFVDLSYAQAAGIQ
jgi:ABC-type nitrate/sulfonate/bicarbonate transport system substrate-binding protein